MDNAAQFMNLQETWVSEQALVQLSVYAKAIDVFCFTSTAALTSLQESLFFLFFMEE